MQFVLNFVLICDIGVDIEIYENIENYRLEWYDIRYGVDCRDMPYMTDVCVNGEHRETQADTN